MGIGAYALTPAIMLGTLQKIPNINKPPTIISGRVLPDYQSEHIVVTITKNISVIVNYAGMSTANNIRLFIVFDFETINFANWLWAVVFVPIAWYLKAYLNTLKNNKNKNDELVEKALKNLNNDEIRSLIREELAPLILRQDSLENDFKNTNKSFHEFTQSFYAKINEVMLSIVGLKK